MSLPSTLEYIGNQAFYNTKGLTSIVIPEGVVSIGYYAFGGSGVIAVSLPSTLRSLGYAAFFYSQNLVSIYSHSVQPANKSSSTPTSIFSNLSATVSVIYVPFGSGEAYRNHADWAEVADKIVEMEPHADPIDTIEELSAIVEQILAEMEELNSNKGLWENILDAINNWGQQIVDAIASMPVIGDSITQVQDAIGNLQDDVDQLPNDITTGIGDLMDQHQASAELKGNDSANEILEIIPDQSGDFLASLSTLTAVLNYEGTAAVITMPAIQIPSVGGLFPAFTVLEEQKINLEYYFNQTPEVLIVIIRALFDIAIVGYCIKEFLDLVGAAVNGFGEGFARQLNGDE